MEPCDRAICFGLRGLLTGLHVPNDYSADFVARAPQKLIGFMSLDPTEPTWLDDFEHGRADLKLKGVKLGPMYAGFDPTDPKLDPLYSNCVKHNLPILFHMGTSFVRFGPLEFSRPILIDAVAQTVSRPQDHHRSPWPPLGGRDHRRHPQAPERLFRRRRLHYRPWQFYHSMMLAQEYATLHKIFFGSDYPFTTPAASLRGIRGLNRFCVGTALPQVSEQAIEEMIHRDAIALLWGGEP